MANKDKGLFEAQELIEELQNRIAEATAEAKALASQEEDLLAKAETAAESAERVHSEAMVLETKVKSMMPLLKVLGLEEDAKLALSALQDEAKALIQAALDKQEELVLEAQLLWEGREQAKALIKAERKAEEDRRKAEAQAHRAHVARACKALKALTQGSSLEELLRLYPKRHGQARKGKFGDATPDDANSIRLEMLRRALHGAGFFPSVVEDIPQKNWDEANAAFRNAQTEARKAEEQEGTLAAAGVSKLGNLDEARASKQAEITELANSTVMACGVPKRQVDLSCLPDRNGHDWVRGQVQGTKVNLRVDAQDRWLTELQRIVA